MSRAPIDKRALRDLRVAWAAGVMCATCLPLVAFGWQQLDRRPAWVMAVVASADSRSEVSALGAERRAVDEVVRRIARRPLVAAEKRAERAVRIGNGTTFRAERIIVVRADSEARLQAVTRDLRSIPDTTVTEPRRALHIGDLVFAFVLAAMLLTLATLERSALSDADPFPIDAPLVTLNLIGLGFLAAGAAVLERSSARPLAIFVAVALVPTVIWLVRARSRWTADSELRARYATIVWLVVLVIAAWLARLIGA